MMHIHYVSEKAENKSCIMKHLKGLIHMEMQPSIIMGVYFLFVNLLAALIMLGETNRHYTNYLAYGVGDFNNWVLATEMPIMLFIGYGLGILLLVYLQFRHDKSIEISRFMKALPYTNQEKGLVKIALGFLSFTIPFLIYIIVFLCIRGYSMHLYKEIYCISPYGEMAQYLNKLSVHFSFIGVTYLKILVFYMMLMMYQYLVSHNVGSIIIGLCTACVPVYLWLSWTCNLSHLDQIQKVNTLLTNLYVGKLDYNVIRSAGGNPSLDIYYISTEGIPTLAITYFIMLIIFIAVIFYQIKKQRIENADILIPGKVIRGIFIVGVALCGGCIMKDITKVVLNEMLLGNAIILHIIFFIIGLVVSAGIAFKIAGIGLRHEEEVQ